MPISGIVQAGRATQAFCVREEREPVPAVCPPLGGGLAMARGSA
jgi:hypothetical protein